MWNHTHHLLRSLLPPTGRIIGPSLSTGFGTRAPGDNATFATDWLWQDFLVFAHANDCMPDVYSFHPFLDPTGGDVTTGAKYLTAFLQEHNMPHELPISANEYGGSWNEVPGYPGAQLSYLANLEKAGVQSAMRACFHDAPTDNCSCGNATLNGLLTCEAVPRPRSAYWVYVAYGAMKGRMLARDAVQRAKPAAPENVVDAMMSVSINLSASSGVSATAELLVAYFPCTPRDLYSPTTVYPAGCTAKTSANKSVTVRLENLPATLGVHPIMTTRRIPGDCGVAALDAPITIVPGERLSVTDTGVLELTLEMAPQDAWWLSFSSLKADDMTAGTEPPMTDSGYSCGIGAGLAGGDLLQAAGLTLAEAEEWCASNSSCAAFTFEHNNSGCSQLQTTAGSRTSIAKVFFKTGQSANTDANWRNFAKTNFTPNFSPKPSYRGCDKPPGSLLPWCDRSKSHAARVELLLGQLTLTEKIGLLSPTPSLGNPCNTHTVGAPHLGLSDYMWLEEANTGVSSACLGPGHCATTFAGPLGLGASFNRSSWYAKGSVLGNEMRAMNNIGWFRDAGGTTTEKLGLTVSSVYCLPPPL
jgi:hypothetical protein